MGIRRTLPATLITAGLITALAGCGGTPAAPGASTAPAAPATSAATGVAAACGSLLQLDGVPAPEGGPQGPPPAEAVKEFGATVTPVLAAAMAQAPAALTPSLVALEPFYDAAATQGVAPDFENPAFTGAIAGYEKWAHENCGYQQVSLAGTDFHFTGAPATLKAGPVSILLENESATGQFHVAVLAKAGPDMTLEKFLATPMEELMATVELVPGGAAAAPGQTGGMLVDLEPGRYFLLCPVGDEGQLPHHLQGMVNEVTVT